MACLTLLTQGIIFQVETGGDTAIAWHASMSPQHFTAWIEPSVSVDQFLDTINKCRISQGLFIS